MEVLENLGMFAVPAIFISHLFLYLLATIGSLCASELLGRFSIGKQIDTRDPRQGQIHEEVSWSLSTIAIATIYLFLGVQSIGQLYPGDFLTAFVNILLFLFLYDFYMYATHRAFHTKILSRYHSRHHRSGRVTPFASLSMHPVEATVNYFPFLLLPLFVPISLTVYLGLYIYLLFGIVFSHSNFNLAHAIRSDFLNDLNTFHQRHHLSGSANFGFLYTHWDWLLGTKHEQCLNRPADA